MTNLHRPTLEAARNDLVRHATHMEYDCPSDVPEPCGQWCNICNRHIDDADHTKGHADACTIAKLNDILALGDVGGDGWQTIDSAPKDRTWVLGLFKDDPEPNRPDIKRGYGGTQIVMRHPGLADDGFDIGWGMRGTGGFPDEWFVGWRPLPSPQSVPQLQPDSTGGK
jgi:hypothetical protein